MPIYEYQCEKCGTFEVTQRITEKQLAKCPTCKGKVKKLISNTSFQLKGTGWYVTDYARKGSTDGKTESSTTPSTESSTKPSESKSESKKSDAPAKSGDDKASTASSSAAT